MKKHNTVILLLFLFLLQVDGGCYFPVEVQGEYVTQSMIDSEIAYTSITIAYDSIPGWGQCHSRHGLRGHRHVLQDVTVNGDHCYKCVKIQVRSANVIQVQSAESVYQCYTSPEEALLTCPRSEAGQSPREVMLYKTRGYYGARDNFAQVLCPLFGQWRVSYTDHSTPSLSCSSPSSRASNCHAGYKLELALRGCSTSSADRQLQFKCLGSWRGDDGQHYVSLLDTQLVQMDEAPRARYRCGIYKHDPSLGVTWLSLSNDSTCHNQLWSHNRGQQTIQLHSLHPATRSGARCSSSSGRFPYWSQGDWGEVRVDGGHIVYRDTATMVQYDLSLMTRLGGGQYLVKVEAGQCGALSGYTCLSLQRRSDHVMEMVMGTVVTSYQGSGAGLCPTGHTLPWLTLTRGHDIHVAGDRSDACPLSGQYSGTLPDGEGLCARSTTFCDSPNLMKYQVYNCQNSSEIYEDRLYRCYGVFQEDGLTYTPVKRLDLPNKECFVGVTEGRGESTLHKIIEAGTNCGRNKDPASTGMVLRFDNHDCDNMEEEEDIGDDATEDRTVNVRRLICDNDDINNELSNEDNEVSAVDNGQEINSEESIDSGESEEEAVNQIVTQISGSAPCCLPSYHYWTLIVVLVTSLIIQH